jgi:RecA/RadA recombinase
MVVNTMLIDVKHYFDPYYSKAMGVNVDSLIVYFFALEEKHVFATSFSD